MLSMRRRAQLQRAIGTSLIALLCVAATARAAGAFCANNVLAPGGGDRIRTLWFDGQIRSYILYVPPGYTGKAPVPLVIDLHGWTSSALQQSLLSGFRQKADEIGFLAAWPQGLNNSWNAMDCCPPSSTTGVDDVGFIRALVGEIVNLGYVDPSRVYVTGLSNGGSMSHRLACDAADVFAAAAPVSYPLDAAPVRCNPVRPVSVVHFHGLNDAQVPYDGGGPFNDRFGGDVLRFMSAQESLATWAQINACTGAPQTLPLGGPNRCETFATCGAGVRTALCSLDGSHVLYLTQNALNIADYAWDTVLSRQSLPMADHDGDGVPDVADNCPTVFNPNQVDADGDCVGNVCQATAGPKLLAPAMLNVRAGTGAGDTTQRTFLTTDPIVAKVGYYDPADACVGTAPTTLKFFVFNKEGQLVLGRNRDSTGGVSGIPVAIGSKYQEFRADLGAGALPVGAYNLVFMAENCTATSVLVSEFYAIEVVAP
ncbi:Esterase PHB depolymerase [Candidatus Methylomirabilis lanthanidiphila]|uniref:Esterase PHB depolymerase n=1 Tax=Candidatus Methylomirabilis lanthanidiphila TaxID=2211376 RepID=A0A564ZP82_9BACT|nr:prolyl oligopeptidase family serine peptidase [Candidatus Methylomirabilis lanthanidiphila]VUZ86657.1 Esterase PHB depolymerase [Candidatus Methylomirabilis lanthanidiphila]